MKKMIKHFGLLLTLCLLTSTSKAKEILMAFSLDIPPYIFQEYDKGIEIDMINAALAVRGHVIKPVYFPLGRIPLAFRNETVDAVMGDMGVDLSLYGGFYADPAIIYQNVFITLHKNNMTIREPKDLDGLRVVSFQESEKRYPKWMKKVKDEKRLYGVSNQMSQVRLLLLERYDVVLSDKYIFKYFLKELQDKSKQPDVLLDEHNFLDLNTDNYRPIFRDEKIRDDFNFGLEQIKKTGQYQKIYSFYLNN
ncbi:substrate-binding periplasmic protein [Psychromonas sp. KJ10-10]|uniref:substrate-binding periplasmic protein n=1 Tax=Psychromonas sp. KJ10-10 TaxID=3391823 RepID=UPI0039B674F6